MKNNINWKNIRSFAIILLCFFCYFKTLNCQTNKNDLFFPILAWDDVRKEETIKKMAECGINLIAFTPPELLDACETHGVKAILFDGRITQRWDTPYNADKANIPLRELINKYNEHPATYGYHLKDEPSVDGLKELGRSSQLINKLAPDKWGYINLNPGWGNWYDSTYVQLFVDESNPKFISYDNYAIQEYDEYSIGEGYWDNLWDIRSASLRNKIPFHTILLTAAHFNYRVTTFNDLSLQVYGALAYGAKGLGYYKFISESLQVMDAPDLGNWRGAPLDEFHDIDPIAYSNLKRINKRILTMAPVLLKLRSDDVYHLESNSIPSRNHGVMPSSLIQGMEMGDNIVYGEKFVVGEFTHTEDNSKWLMIVNKSLRISGFIRPKFSENVDIKTTKIFSQVTGKLEDMTHWYALSPGQGMLIRLGYKNI